MLLSVSWSNGCSALELLALPGTMQRGLCLHRYSAMPPFLLFYWAAAYAEA